MTEHRSRTHHAGRVARRLGSGLVPLVVLAACASATVDTTVSPMGSSAASPTSSPVASTVADDDACAHVIAVDISGDSAGYAFSVTVSSTETGWDKYADLWTVAGLDGTVYGERVLAHPHVEEQPFTRSLSGVSIPAGTAEVVIAARDSVLGFCGDAMTVALEAAG
jgi:hypothetical protein